MRVFVCFIVGALSAHSLLGFELTKATSNQSPFLELPEYRTPSPEAEPVSYFELASLKVDEDLHEDFWRWKQDCREAIAKGRSPITQPQFLHEITAFINQFKNEKNLLMHEKNWVVPSHGDAVMPGMDFLLGLCFTPYAMKQEVDTDEKTILIGDIHGDIESFNSFLEDLSFQNITELENPFKLKPKSRIVLLGDYTDRGEWGIEVLYALSRFMRTNNTPEDQSRVIALRGNHEDIRMNMIYGLAQEMLTKFHNTSALNNVEEFYNCLPLALYLKSGKHAILACHGGIEPGFTDTQSLLDAPGKVRYIVIEQLRRKTMLEKLPSEFIPALSDLETKDLLKDFDPCQMEHPLIHFGFLWTDYSFKSDSFPDTPIKFTQDRGMVLPEQITKKLFEINSSPTCTLIGNIRGHQHTAETMMRILNRDNKSDPNEQGMAKLWVTGNEKQPAEKIWPGIVCTLCACPRTGPHGYGKFYGYTFGAYAILHTAEQLEQWRLKVQRFF